MLDVLNTAMRRVMFYLFNKNVMMRSEQKKLNSKRPQRATVNDDTTHACLIIAAVLRATPMRWPLTAHARVAPHPPWAMAVMPTPRGLSLCHRPLRARWDRGSNHGQSDGIEAVGTDQYGTGAVNAGTAGGNGGNGGNGDGLRGGAGQSGAGRGGGRRRRRWALLNKVRAEGWSRHSNR